MEYSTFYEVSNQSVGIIVFFPIFLSLGGLGILFRTLLENRNLEKEDKNRFSLYCGLIFGIFFCVLSIIQIPKSFEKLENTKKIYTKGNFKTIEGEIRNFDPMPYSGHKHERFTINNIPFAYANFESSYYGFKLAASHGGPIKQNGQEIRMGYITDKYGRNIILKLELKK